LAGHSRSRRDGKLSFTNKHVQNHSAARALGAFLLQGDQAFTLKVNGGIDDQSRQHNEEHNCGGDRFPIVFEAPRVRPPTVVARATSTVKVTICHRKANVLSFAEFGVSPARPITKAPRSGAKRGSLRSPYANGAIDPNQSRTRHFVPVRDLPLLLSVPTRRHWTGRGRPTYVMGPPTDGSGLAMTPKGRVMTA
jgi:hypothetical protein